MLTFYVNADAAQLLAFSANLKPTTSVNIGAAINFNDITLNVGNNYNQATGHFTCPKTGVYSFSHKLVSSLTTQAFGNIVKDGKTLTQEKISYHNNEGLPYHTASNVTVECQKGERIWVKSNVRFKSEIFRNTISTFSGYLLGGQ